MTEAWAVMLNGYIEAICDSREKAGEIMEQIKIPYGAHNFRPVGEDGWAAAHVKSLYRQRFFVNHRP